jgi:DNA-binding CsgD family transcriptional regulator
MDADWLAERLGEGRSIESIAREAGKAPSTVAYWATKHGLVSQHAARHAARGGVDHDRLEQMAAAGMSIRRMAAELGLGYSTVRHWLRQHGITTNRARILADTAEARVAGELDTIATCTVHGPTVYVRSGGSFRCHACRSEAVSRRRRRVKAILIEEAGGCCILCGYDGSPAGLHFHHVDPGTKSFAVASKGVTRSLAAARAEARKCVLLCARCHAEVEAGATRLPFPRAGLPGTPEVHDGG